MIFIVDAADDIGIGSLAGHVALEDHVRLTECARKWLVCRVWKEIELALILILVVLSLCHNNRDEDSILILRLDQGGCVLPLEVVLVAHINEAAYLILGE
jgi:hypothetical protein